jgi:small subunit ribosomal protein S9
MTKSIVNSNPETKVEALTTSDRPTLKLRKQLFNCTGSVYATGKRKTATARIWLKPGSGRYIVRSPRTCGTLQNYFSEITLREQALLPFKSTDSLQSFDVFACVRGGGLSAQAQAVLHGISKALDSYNHDVYHPILKSKGYLTRNPRRVEPKKHDRVKARKSGQSSKR